jgi:hypothetical protein
LFVGFLTWGLAEFVDAFVYLKRAQNTMHRIRRDRRMRREEAKIVMRSSRNATGLGLVGIIKASTLGIIVLLNLVFNWPNPELPEGFTHLGAWILLVAFLLGLLISVLRRNSDFSIENTLFSPARN